MAGDLSVRQSSGWAWGFPTDVFSVGDGISPPYLPLETPAAGGVSGTLAHTNANDASAGAGATTVVGALARTNANDTVAASGTTTITGTLARTNASDTSAASGTVGSSVTGTLARTNANDTSAATGTVTVVGTLSRTNASDTAAASGSIGGASPTGTVAYTNANDTLAGSGTTTVVGALARANANDTSAASGTTTIRGVLSYTNANDACVAAGSVAGAVTGTLTYTNANDAAAAIGTVPDSRGSGGWEEAVIARHQRNLSAKAKQAADLPAQATPRPIVEPEKPKPAAKPREWVATDGNPLEQVDAEIQRILQRSKRTRNDRHQLDTLKREQAQLLAASSAIAAQSESFDDDFEVLLLAAIA